MENRSFNTFCGKVVIGKNKESQRARKEENITATFSVGRLHYWQSIFTVLSNLPSLNRLAVNCSVGKTILPCRNHSHPHIVEQSTRLRKCCVVLINAKKKKKKPHTHNQKNPKVVDVGDDLNNSSKTTLHFPLITWMVHSNMLLYASECTCALWGCSCVLST